MSGERPKPPARARGRLKAALKEFIRLLDQVQADKAATRLQLDMARDAGLEVCRKMLQRIHHLEQKVGRSRDRQSNFRARLLQLVNSLANSPIRLPRPRNLPPSDLTRLERDYQQLRTEEFPGLARALHQAAGESDVLAYQLFLVEEILQKAVPILVEHLVHDAPKPNPLEDANQFLAALHHHLAGNINKTLARKTHYKTTPEMGRHIGTTLERSLHFLLDLLTTDPAVRLLFPPLGSDFHPQHHEASPGRPTTGNLAVRATVFPGLIALEHPERTLAPALVYTKKLNPEARPLPGEGD